MGRLGPRAGGAAADGVVVFADRDGDAAMGGDGGDAPAQPAAQGGPQRKAKFNPYGDGAQRRVVAGGPAAAGGGQQRGANHFGPSYGGNQPRKPGSVDVSITGWSPSPTGTRDQLIQFLRKRSSRALNITSVRTTDGGTTVLVTVGSWAEASALQRMSGIRFDRNKLSLDPVKAGAGDGQADGEAGAQAPQGQPAAPQQDRIAVLRSYLKWQYNEQTSLLDLSGMSTHPALLEAGLGDLNNEKVGGVVCKMIGEEFPQIQSLALNANRLNTLNPLRTLFQRAPGLVNLSLEQNNLNNLRDLEAIKNAPLRELRMRGNPLYDREVARHVQQAGPAASGPTKKFRGDVLAMFPTLLILDDHSIEEGPEEGEISFGPLPGAQNALIGPDSVWPVPVRKGWVDSEATVEVVDDLVNRYFPLFDSNRQALHDLYHSDAVFSYASNAHIPPGRKPSTLVSRTTGQFADDMANWQAGTRNFQLTKDAGRRLSSLACGPAAIVAALRRLPATRHPTDAARRVVDAWMQTDVATGSVKLVVAVHGDFIEAKMNLSKSYDRLFVLVPAREGSPAAKAGARYEILNDQLTVRPWSQNLAWRDALEQLGAAHAPPPQPSPQPQALAGAGPAGAPGAVPVPAVPVPPGMDPLEAERRRIEFGLNDEQHAKVLAVSTRTGLVYQVAHQCLAETGWDFERALAAFEAVRAQVPPEAYLRPA